MVKVIDDHFMVCQDCLMAIANDDFTGLDYHLSPEEAEKRMQEIKEAMASVDGDICAGNPEEDEDFSTTPCHCCGDRLHGSRHHCVILK